MLLTVATLHYPRQNSPRPPLHFTLVTGRGTRRSEAGLISSQSYRWQATERCGRASCGAGTSIEQRGMTFGQRGWNTHPEGGLSNDGGAPGIPRRTPFTSSDDRLDIRSCVYGCIGDLKMS